MNTPFEFLNSTIRVAPGRRVIPADEFKKFTYANDLLREAQQEAELIKAEAREVYEAQKLQGYKDGAEQANDEKAVFCFQIAQDFATIVQTMEQKLAGILPQILRNFLGDLGEEQGFKAYISRALQEMVTEEKLAIKVHPSKRRMVEELVDRLQAKQEGFTRFLRVTGDNTLEADQATLETNSSIVVLDLQRQLQLLEEYAAARLKNFSVRDEEFDDSSLHHKQVLDAITSDDSNTTDESHIAADVVKGLYKNDEDEEERFRVFE